MKATDAPGPDLEQTLAWLRQELAEMQAQDQRLLLMLTQIHHVLEELRTESARWEDAKFSEKASPIRARAGSEGRAGRPISSKQLAQLLSGADSRRSSLP
ncbi:uncharacterized protein C20orf202 homolog [Suncus etruscus]|uniref:uncharacterized protein C20orf202 homolog n=1 Tax=Suncus etruscus TaxID=109475 RepID=UPI002110D3CA|nr:uncharacterized protein C20orf202 homolog [Suncus etruscus]